MNSISVSTTGLLLLILIILTQGISIFKIKKRRKDGQTGAEINLRLFGLFLILQGLLASAIIKLYLSTSSVFNFILGAILVEGIGAFILFVLVTLLVFYSGAIIWAIARQQTSNKRYWAAMLLSSIVIWLAAILWKDTLTEFSSYAKPVFLYRLWLYPVLMVFCIAISEIYVQTQNQIDLAFLRNLIRSRIISLSKILSWKRLQNIKPSNRQVQSLIAILTVGSGLFMIVLDVGLLGPTPGLYLYLVGWLWFSEIYTEGLLGKFIYLFRKGHLTNPESRFRKKLRAGLDKFLIIFKVLPAWVGERLKLSEKPVTAIIKTLILFLLLLALNDALNYGKTFIQPFQVTGLEADQIHADSTGDLLINQLGLLYQQLQPDILIPSLASGNQKRNQDPNNKPKSTPKYIRASENNSAFDAVQATSQTIKIGSAEIPLGVFTDPLQTTFRPRLKIRTIGGSIYKESDKVILSGNVSDGRAWIIQRDIDSEDAVNSMMEELAFQIISSEDGYDNLGMTNSWAAFESFRAGMDLIKKFEIDQDYDALMTSITEFRKATRLDPQFALAYYRLGLSLQTSQQPGLAERALNQGLMVKQDFLPLMNALAYHLYFFNSYQPTSPAYLKIASTASESDETDSDEYRKNRAREMWIKIITTPGAQVSLPDRASAYHGLCLDSFYSINSIENQNYRLAFFYCYKAHSLYERLPQELRAAAAVRQANAYALNLMGVFISHLDPRTHRRNIATDDWFCMPIDKNDKFWDFHPTYARASLGYYDKALNLLEDPVIRCNAAISAWLTGNNQPMEILKKSSNAHFWLAYQFQEIKDYRSALMEYQKAIDLDPLNRDALNNFAYTYWLYRLSEPKEDLENLGFVGVAQVEEYVHRAIRLAKAEQDYFSEVVYTSTLVEVLNSKGRYQEAIDAILPLISTENVTSQSSMSEKIFAFETLIPDHWIFNEVRWDLAQSLLCLPSSAETIKTNASVEELNNLAGVLFETIRQIEQHHDYQAFTQAAISSWLNPESLFTICSEQATVLISK
jgi:tetratricopeptide (TPR) repeat protein